MGPRSGAGRFRVRSPDATSPRRCWRSPRPGSAPADPSTHSAPFSLGSARPGWCPVEAARSLPMLTSLKHQGAVSSLPFDNHLLDRLMDQAHIDVALTTSKHNVQSLLGGHRTFFFDHMEAMGPSRYLPVLVYPKGAPEQAAYVGHGTENFQHALSPVGTPEVYTGPAGSAESMQKTVDHRRKLGLKPRRIGVEWPFLPADAAMLLRRSFPDSEIVDSLWCWNDCAPARRRKNCGSYGWQQTPLSTACLP